MQFTHNSEERDLTMNYVMTSTAIFDLSPKAATLLLFLQDKANNKTRSSFWRREKIAAICEMSLSSFARALRELKNRKLVEVRERYEACGRQRSNEYVLLEGFAADEEEVLHSSPVQEFSAHRVLLTGNVLKVYLYLIKRCGKQSISALSKNQIASACGVSTSTVYRCLKELAENGYIEYEQQTEETANGHAAQARNLYRIRQSSPVKTAFDAALLSLFSFLTPSPMSEMTPLRTISPFNFMCKEKKNRALLKLKSKLAECGHKIARLFA